MTTLNRRTLLKTGLLAAATGPALLSREAALAVATEAAHDGVFGYGVASGDPTGSAVVLWTRVTPSAAAVPGSGAGPRVEVVWELAADEAFTRVLRSGTASTSAARDHTVKVDVTGLAPYTRYWYRFQALGATSPVGRTQTAPDEPGAVHALRLGVVSCSNYTGGFFTAYRALGERDDLDAVLHLGDYVYEYGNGADRYGPASLAGVRDHQPDNEMVTLADYRVRFACYRADPDLALAHRRHPWIVVLDDHEVTNDSWREGAENHTPGTEGDYAARRGSAYQAYLEWLPIREPAPVLYRRFTFGALADLHVIDTRTYRDEPLTARTQGARKEPERELLGQQQREWLFDGLEAGKDQHQWRLLGNQTVLAPFEIPRPLPGAAAEIPVGVPGSPISTAGLAFNRDQWDGYEAERDRLKALVAREGLTDVVVLTGDIHSSWANDVPEDEGTYAPAGPLRTSLMTEFVTTSVTSDNVDDIVGDPGGPRGIAASRALEAAVLASNPHVRFLDFEKHGYGVLDVTPGRAQFDWFWMRSATHPDPRTDPEAQLVHGTSWQTLAGTQQVSPADGPVGARSDSPRVLAAPAATTAPAVAAAAAPAAPVPVAQQLPATGPTGALAGFGALLLAGALAVRRRTLPGG